MRHTKIVTLMFCALTACGEDVSLGAKDTDSGVTDGGICTVEPGADLNMQCGNIQCNGETQYCSASIWPEPCKPLPCECASAPPSQQSCECLMKYITLDCDTGVTCTKQQTGLVVSCK